MGWSNLKFSSWVFTIQHKLNKWINGFYEQLYHLLHEREERKEKWAPSAEVCYGVVMIKHLAQNMFKIKQSKFIFWTLFEALFNSTVAAYCYFIQTEEYFCNTLGSAMSNSLYPGRSIREFFTHITRGFTEWEQLPMGSYFPFHECGKEVGSQGQGGMDPRPHSTPAFWPDPMCQRYCKRRSNLSQQNGWQNCNPKSHNLFLTLLLQGYNSAHRVSFQFFWRKKN